jgi:hypothetical protein
MGKLLLPTLLGVMLTVLFFLLAIFFSKAGSAVFAVIFFPYVNLFSLIAHNLPQWIAMASAYCLFFLQYPVYCVILGNALGDGRFYQRLLLLLALHVSVVVACLMIYEP